MSLVKRFLAIKEEMHNNPELFKKEAHKYLVELFGATERGIEAIKKEESAQTSSAPKKSAPTPNKVTTEAVKKPSLNKEVKNAGKPKVSKKSPTTKSTRGVRGPAKKR